MVQVQVNARGSPEAHMIEGEGAALTPITIPSRASTEESDDGQLVLPPPGLRQLIHYLLDDRRHNTSFNFDFTRTPSPDFPSPNYDMSRLQDPTLAQRALRDTQRLQQTL